MPSSSHLRLQTTVEPISAETARSRYFSSPPQKKQKMSLTQTYYVAASARSKLGKEACRPDHNLRLLVGHANLLDSLMLELQDAERQQEAWFHSTVAKADKPRHVQWIDQIAEQVDDDDSSSDDDDSDSDSDYDEDADFDMVAAPAVSTASVEVDSDDDDEDAEDDEVQYDDLADDADLALVRVASQHSPPELVHDEDSDDDAAASPPITPPQLTLDFSAKEALLTSSYYAPSKPQSRQDSYLDHDHELFLSPAAPNAPLITSY